MADPATPVGRAPNAAAAANLESKEIWGDQDAAMEAELASLTVEQIRQRTTMMSNNIRVLQKDLRSVEQSIKTQKARIDENESKIKLNKQLPYLVANVVELLDLSPEEEEEMAASTAVVGYGDEAKEDGSEESGASSSSSSSSSSSAAASDSKEGGAGAGAGAAAEARDVTQGAEGFSHKKKAAADVNKPKSVVIKTTMRQTVYLPVPGLVEAKDLKPGDLIGTNKDSFLILEKLPTEYDPRVKAMELDEKPAEDYSDIGGADKQIQELIEAVVLPMTHAERFKKLGIKPPKGVLLHGPPGTGKTLLARACAKSTDAVFLKLAGTSLVQMYIGDGAKMVRDAFDLARDKCKDRGGAIIFIDEIDAIGTKRGGEGEGSREVQRTMLELLNQLDGFSSNDKVKVIAATNRPDTLDPALLRSGRLDRKIELPLPDEKSRMRIMQIHSRKMNVDMEDVNFEELARSTEDFNGAMLKAVCVEAGMIALRREATIIKHEDFVEGIQAVQMKKKQEQNYYT